MEKAKYIGKTRSRYSREVFLFYEYRGREYMVVDPHNGYGFDDDIRRQHEIEQAAIDAVLDNTPAEPEPYSGEVEEALEMLWEYWG